MSSRLKSKKFRIVIALVLILIIVSVTAFGYYEDRLQKARLLRTVPRPPLAHGCYKYTKNLEWQKVDCLTPEEVRKFPHPQAHVSPLQQGGGSPGVWGLIPASINSENQIPQLPAFARSTQNIPKIYEATVSIDHVLQFQQEFDTSPNNGGPSAFSIQINTNVWSVPPRAHTYWDQFVFQNYNPTQGGYARLGIWQNDLTEACGYATYMIGKKSDPTCSGTGPAGGYVCQCIKVNTEILNIGTIWYGFVNAYIIPGPAGQGTQPQGTLVVVADLPQGVYSTVTSDSYYLANNWVTVSGTILGSGGGSQAQFTSPTIVQTTLRAEYVGVTTANSLSAKVLPIPFMDFNTAESNNLNYVPGGGVISTTYQPDLQDDGIAQMTTLSSV